MSRLLLLIIMLCSFYTCLGQTTTNLHIVTSPRNHLPGFPNFHFEINGKAYKLKAGECIDKKLMADSIHVVAADKRWVKKETVEVHIPVTDAEVYVWVRVTWTGNFRNPQYGAEVVCKSCFDELKKQCKKTIVEDDD